MKEKIYIVKEHICSGESEFTAAGKARIDVEDILYDWKAKDIKIKIKKNLNENWKIIFFFLFPIFLNIFFNSLI